MLPGVGRADAVSEDSAAPSPTPARSAVAAPGPCSAKALRAAGPAGVLALQRAAGNRAVASLLREETTAPPPPTTTAPATPHVCGPDIDAALTKVFVKIQDDFRVASTWDKRQACTNLHVPPMAIMAWDVVDLFLPNTNWVNNTIGCAVPSGAKGVEDPAGCTNSVWAGGHCHLAGTANYGMFGIVQKLCSDFRQTDSWWWQPMGDMYSESATRNLIGMYKTIDWDDSGPPVAWALATYRGGPTGRPDSGNRDSCSRCGGPATKREFDYSWSPIHGSLWTH